MKLIGIDYGKRRIGLAITDETGQFIRSLPTLDRKTSPRYVSTLRALIEQEQVSQIVVGLPLDPSDLDTAMSHEIRAFAARLEREAGLPVHFVDESLTSRRARDIMLNRKRKHRRNKENIDAVAACLILEAHTREKESRIAPEGS
jgi:putative Holliday junction resolvase